jgi:ABC-2 type transport system permease protein
MKFFRNPLNRALLNKSIGEARLLLFGASLVMFSFCWVRVWIVSLLPMERFKTILEQFQEFERFLPVPFEQLITYVGRIALTYDELIVVMCVAVWAIARGSDCISGELGRGTMEMLLAQPVSRLKILVMHAVTTTVGTATLAVASWVGIWVGIHTTHVKVPIELPFGVPGLELTGAFSDWPTQTVPMASRVDPSLFWPAALNLFALGFFLAGLSTLMSSWDRYRWRTIGIVAGIYVLQLIIKIVGLATDQLSWMLKLTFFTAYEPERFVSIANHSPNQAWSLVVRGENGAGWEAGPLGYDLLLIGLGLVAYVLAALIFRRRDLPAPV